MNRKAQSQVITTVLIILLVLAAIVIVWQVVNTTVREGSKEIEEGMECVGVNFKVVNADTNTITVQREPGGTTNDAEYVILVDGVKTDISGMAAIGQLETDLANFVTPLAAGNHVITSSGMINGRACGEGSGLSITV